MPLFAAEVYDQNRRLKDLGMTPVNLVSVLIGRLSLTLFLSYGEAQEMAAAIHTSALGFMSDSLLFTHFQHYNVVL